MLFTFFVFLSHFTTIWIVIRLNRSFFPLTDWLFNKCLATGEIPVAGKTRKINQVPCHTSFTSVLATTVVSRIMTMAQDAVAADARTTTVTGTVERWFRQLGSPFVYAHLCSGQKRSYSDYNSRDGGDDGGGKHWGVSSLLSVTFCTSKMDDEGHRIVVDASRHSALYIGSGGGYNRSRNDDRGSGGYSRGRSDHDDNGGGYNRGRSDHHSSSGGGGGGGGGGGDDNRMETQRDTIFIQNLPRGVSTDELKDVFSQIGIIKVNFARCTWLHKNFSRCLNRKIKRQVDLRFGSIKTKPPAKAKVKRQLPTKTKKQHKRQSTGIMVGFSWSFTNTISCIFFPLMNAQIRKYFPVLWKSLWLLDVLQRSAVVVDLVGVEVAVASVVEVKTFFPLSSMLMSLFDTLLGGGDFGGYRGRGECSTLDLHSRMICLISGGDRGGDYRGGGGDYRGGGRGASHGSSRDNRSNPY